MVIVSLENDDKFNKWCVVMLFFLVSYWYVVYKVFWIDCILIVYV